MTSSAMPMRFMRPPFAVPPRASEHSTPPASQPRVSYARGAARMGHAKATGTISAPVDKVWAIVRDFGNLAWGGIPGVTLEGEGIGAVRTFTSRGVTIRERLEALDDLGHTLSYSILEPS